MLEKALNQNETKLLTFGQQLRKYRKGKRLTQKELAEKIGISTNLYAMHERDICFPSPKLREKYKLIFKKISI